jgi:beta-glucosidase-like glycosyl hydrolase
LNLLVIIAAATGAAKPQPSQKNHWAIAFVVFSVVAAVAPAATSVTMVSEVIRRAPGLQGVPMSDDISVAGWPISQRKTGS